MPHIESNEEHKRQQLKLVVTACCFQWYADQESHAVVHGRIGNLTEADYDKIL